MKLSINLNHSLRLIVACSLCISVLPAAVRAAEPITEDTEIATLTSSQSSPKEKDEACVWLKRHGTARSVPALAVLLSDEGLSQSARYALESLPGPEAETALIGALAQTNNELKTGVIHSLGVRREAAAVPELVKLLMDADDSVASISAEALGDIASPDALKALEDRLNLPAGPVRNAMVDGCLRGAQNWLAAGNNGAALAAYEAIYQAPLGEFQHVAAWRGMALASGPQGFDLIAKALTNGPAALQMAAVQLVHEKVLPDATGSIAALLTAMEPLAQVALIDALSQRDDPAAAPVIETLLLAKSATPETRMAALDALGNLGDDQAVPLMVGVAAATGDSTQAAARQALALIHRGTPNQTLLRLLMSMPLVSGGPGAVVGLDAEVVEIIRALSERGSVEAIPQLLNLARQPGELIQPAAFQALARLVDQAQLADLVQLVGQMDTDAGRASAAHALVLACRHIQMLHGTVDLAPVVAALKIGSPATRLALLPVCSTAVAASVRDVLRTSLTDPDSGVQAAAVGALCKTMDPGLIPDVVMLAVLNTNEEFRASAIEYFVRLTTQEPTIVLPEADRFKLFAKILPAAGTTAEKRLILSGLAALPDAGAVPMAEAWLTDASVSNEAALAVIGICRHIPGAIAQTTLADVIPKITDNQIRLQAQKLFQIVKSRGDFITTWQYAGPYRKAGMDYRGLFDLVCPPETDDTSKVKWQDMPLNDDPKTSWSMDFMQVFSGEQAVAFARTAIHSDTAQEVILVIHSDDGVKAWLNGTVIHANNVQRAVTSPPDKVKVTLQPGWNHLMLKITQNNQGWGFGVRVTNPDGSPLTGLQVAADPVPAPM